MAVHNKTLHLIAAKLGLAENERVLGKAAELERLLQAKSTAGSNLTDTGKVVICLDLAAGLYGAEFDLKTAIKYSGLKPAMYTNSRKIVQNLLELDTEKLTTSVLCAALQCTEVQDTADRMLEEYQKHAKMEVDLNLPQYVCMAVYHACRINKVKVSKSKLTEKSRLKPAQWSKLDEDWTAFVSQHFIAPVKKRGRPQKTKTIEKEQEHMDIDKQIEELEPEIEPYESWKKRMLEQAYAELAELEKREALERAQQTPFTPRRSPRKTPQKSTPNKQNGQHPMKLRTLQGKNHTDHNMSNYYHPHHAKLDNPYDSYSQNGRCRIQRARNIPEEFTAKPVTPRWSGLYAKCRFQPYKKPFYQTMSALQSVYCF